MPKITSKNKVFLCDTLNDCELNQLDSQRLYCFLQGNKFDVVTDFRKADVAIINTCGVSQMKESRGLEIIRKYYAHHNWKKFIICGCLVKISQRMNEFRDNVILIAPKEFERFDEIFEHKVSIKGVWGNSLKRFSSEGQVTVDTRHSGRHYYISIASGCMNHCSYCAIKHAKGGVTSKTEENIIAEFMKGLRAGFKSFFLLADDCGSYGQDIGTDFAELLNNLYQFKDADLKLSIFTFEPKNFLRLFPKINKKIFQKMVVYLEVPLQSNSSRILKLMNREYRVENVLRSLKEIKKINPQIKLATDIIYGFPTESRRDFLRTFDLISHFNEIQYSLYSDRPGTRASMLDNKISSKEALWRMLLIKKMQKQLKCVPGVRIHSFAENQKGRDSFQKFLDSLHSVVRD